MELQEKTVRNLFAAVGRPLNVLWLVQPCQELLEDGVDIDLRGRYRRIDADDGNLLQAAMSDFPLPLAGWVRQESLFLLDSRGIQSVFAKSFSW